MMGEIWQELYGLLGNAGRLDDFVKLMAEQAMRVGRIACQVGQSEEARRDALSEMRFCLARADEAAEALKAQREKANSRNAGGFQEGGSALA